MGAAMEHGSAPASIEDLPVLSAVSLASDSQVKSPKVTAADLYIIEYARIILWPVPGEHLDITVGAVLGRDLDGRVLYVTNDAKFDGYSARSAGIGSPFCAKGTQIREITVSCIMAYEIFKPCGTRENRQCYF